VFSAGHQHQASSRDAGARVPRSGGVLVVQAGTATSTRVREQEQSFNVIDIGDGSATIAVHAWTGDQFRSGSTRRYEWHEGRWLVREASETAH